VTVTVRTVGLLKSLLGRGELRIDVAEAATVGDLLATLAATYGGELAAHLAVPDGPAAHPPLRVLVNGRDIGALNDRQTVLADGDDVLVLTPIAGG
jgi:molybdopterin converting factor small subunit